ncbi:endoplasmic reticulum metallopeptidase [Skeletonema marinoi]|uniref:Endoplasmic reticulum metallopeptidase n=1 Tax=Skeletonema marinoi TaxID=267567 RepID=A0AAD8Y218_9STRA|nr:endoplasmic reticulum metallopeptidase [Skeletonema marinoi]
MLEMASVLSSSPTKLKRDVLFVFTDAEEVGLLGSTMFFEGDDAHPWSLLPSVAINLDNSAVCGKEMFEKSNSRYGADAYFKYAAHPKAFSFSEWYDANIEEGWDDAVVYEKHGLHALRLGCWSNSWAYHSIDDDIEHVSKGALQHMGENVLAIVKGIASETNFPDRMQQKEGTNDEMGNSGLFYFTLIGGYIFSLPSKTASIYFPTLL